MFDGRVTVFFMFKPLQQIYDAITSCVTEGLQMPSNRTVAGLVPSAASDRDARGERVRQPKSRSHGPAGRKVLHDRQHYRIVFKDLATPLFSVSFLSQVFTVLADVAEGMIRLWFSVTALNFG